MFSALFDSLFSSASPLDCEAPGVHAGENPSSQSDTPSDIISDPEQAKEHKQQLGDKIDQADGATAPPADDDEEEEEEEVPDVSAPVPAVEIRRAWPLTWERVALYQQGEQIREGQSRLLLSLGILHRPHTRPPA